PVERGEGPAGPARFRAVRRAAAAALHRPGDRRLPAGHPDGRAVLGAGPHFDARHRGPDQRTQERVHGGHRHPQHAAGCACLGQDRVLQHRRHRQARQAHRVRRHRHHLQQARSQGHRGLRLRPFRI
ncbi:MAG: Phosphate transport ATP-binding protein PstB, partial [uncultured Arthrobacter sp.]